MTAEPLWTEPSWTAAWAVGDRVTSRWTRNSGTVVRVVEGRHLLVRWDKWGRDPKGYTARHSSDWGLTKVDET